MATAQPAAARSWNPDFKHSDRERWICIYPAYINSKKTVAEGRKIPKNKAVENPTYVEIRDIVVAAGLELGIENKVYPRELNPRENTCRGRIRVHLKDENGKPIMEQFASRKSLLLHIGEMLPKLKSRQSGGGGGSSQQPSGGGGGGGGKKSTKKGKGRK